MPHANPRARTVDRRDKQASHRALLAAEAALLLTLGAATVSAWKRAVARRKSPAAAMRLAAVLLGSGSARAIARAALLARRLSLRTLAANLRRHGHRGPAAEVVAMIGDRAAKKAAKAHAARVGASMAEHWRKAATKAAEKTTGASTVARTTANAESFRVRMVAATETSQAFNEAREEAFQAIAKDIDPKAAEQPWREWDATLDKDTCEVCEPADGAMVPLGESFNAGTPGKVHPSCRCIDQIVWMPRGFRGRDTS